MSQTPVTDAQPLGYVVVRITEDERKFFYTHSGTRRDQRWWPNLSKARVYDDLVKAANIARRANIYAGAEDHIVVWELNYSLIETFHSPASP